MNTPIVSGLYNLVVCRLRNLGSLTLPEKYRMVSTDEKHLPGVKLALLAALIAVVVSGYVMFQHSFSLESLASQETALRTFQEEYPWLAYGIAFLIYVAVTGLSLPGATVLTLVYGWNFGVGRGVLLVSFASTLGATIAFLLSRYLLRAMIENRFGDRLARFNEALEQEGVFYLFSLRLIPVVPFFVVNVVMGLTRMRIVTFWWVSQIGMLAATVIYLYAGSTLPSLNQLADPSQLRVNDVRDWDGLLEELQQAGNGQAATPADQIWTNFPEDLKVMIQRSSPGAIDGPTQKRLVMAINQQMIRSEFSLSPDLPETARNHNQDAAPDPGPGRQLTQANRAVLVAAFPHLILPPQPMVHPQFLIALALLGVFPLVMRKIVQRLSTHAADRE